MLKSGAIIFKYLRNNESKCEILVIVELMHRLIVFMHDFNM